MLNIKDPKLIIKGKRIYLRKLTEKDATQEYCSWLNDPEVNRYLETKHATIEYLKNYIREKNESKCCLFLGIFFKENDKHIGNIKLEPINFKNKKATVGIIIGDKKYWGKRIGSEAMKLLIEWAFNNLHLNEINLGVISTNKVAIRMYKKIGFKVKKTEKGPTVQGKILYNRIFMCIKSTDLA